MNHKSSTKARNQHSDMLAGVARSIGSALGTVAAKIHPTHKPLRRTARKSKTTRAVNSTTKKRSTAHSGIKARRSRAVK